MDTNSEGVLVKFAKKTSDISMEELTHKIDRQSGTI